VYPSGERHPQAKLTDEQVAHIRDTHTSKHSAQSNRLKSALDGAVFYVGRPCHKGHSGVRYVATKHCRECIIDRLRARRGK
jgi:hypothetical protein